MAQKYLTRRYESKITEVEIVRETDACVWVMRGGSERREAKTAEMDQYHDSWEAAKAYLLERANKRVARAKEALQSVRSELGQIESLKNPGTDG